MGEAKYPREWEWQMNIDEHAGLGSRGKNYTNVQGNVKRQKD